MIQIIAPKNKRLVWYLSMEEYLAANVKEDTIFFWSVDPTVIFGRHQVIENEVNLEFCRKNHVQFYRRKSGGGCVYADRGNLMTSFVTPSIHSEQVFQYYLDTVAGALQKLGFRSAKSEHNDILVEHLSNDSCRISKCSGNACYALPTGTIVHGTMLYNVDFDALQQAITPSREKLEKHGVESVRQRVANLKVVAEDGMKCGKLVINSKIMESLDSFETAFASALCDGVKFLEPDDIARIDKMEEEYLDEKFIFGHI